MSNMKRNHGIFSVSGDVVTFVSNTEDARRDGLEVVTALDTIFNQMLLVAFNRTWSTPCYTG